MTLVRPAADEEQTRHASRSSQLRPAFLSQMDALRAKVLADAPLKRLYGAPVDGPSLVLFAGALLEAMNTPGVVPSIPRAWETVVEERCRAAAEAATAVMRAALSAASAQAAPDAPAWAAACCEALGTALERYEADAIVDGRVHERRAALLVALRREVDGVSLALLTASRKEAEGAAAAVLSAVDLGRGVGEVAAVAVLRAYEAAPRALGCGSSLGYRSIALALALAAERAASASALEHANALSAAHAALASLEVRLTEAKASGAAAEAEASRQAQACAQLRAELSVVSGARVAEAHAAEEALETARREAQELTLRAQRSDDLASARAEALEAAGARLEDEKQRRVDEAAAWRERLEAHEARLRAEAQAAAASAAAAISTLEERLSVSEAQRLRTVAEGEREAVAAAERLGFKQEQLDAASRLAADAASEAAELRRAIQKAHASEAAALTAANAAAALKEERDALREQIGHFHERAALLPERYASQLFSAVDPSAAFVQQLASKPSIGAEELAGTAEQMADAHLGNIAAVASLAVAKLTPFARWFGGGGGGGGGSEGSEEEDDVGAAPSALAPPVQVASRAAQAGTTPAQAGTNPAQRSTSEAPAPVAPPPARHGAQASPALGTAPHPQTLGTAPHPQTLGTAPRPQALPATLPEPQRPTAEPTLGTALPEPPRPTAEPTPHVIDEPTAAVAAAAAKTEAVEVVVALPASEPPLPELFVPPSGNGAMSMRSELFVAPAQTCDISTSKEATY